MRDTSYDLLRRQGVARQHFVNTVAHARTPLWLARHRVRASTANATAAAQPAMAIS